MTPNEAMRLAIEEGKKGAGFVSPNPLVGCVIVDRDGQLLSVGHHARVGEAHAEINALNAIQDPATLEGAHVFVTLEPCAHQGRTGPCATKLAELPIAAVTYGVKDPNPLVAGKGAEILRQAGKRVEQFAELQPELERLSEAFLTTMRLKRPYVALKVASSLDGKIALRDGTSKWITGEKSRAHVHYLRGCHDAVVSGVGTFLRDLPRLDSRDERFRSKPQKVVLLDPEGKSYAALKGSDLASARSADAIFIVTAPGVAKPPVGKQLIVTDRDRDFNLRELLEVLRGEGLNSLMVEAGPRTASAFIKSRLVDRLYLFMAPKLLGDGLSWTSAFSLNSLDQAVSLDDVSVEHYDQDLLLTGRFRWT